MIWFIIIWRESSLAAQLDEARMAVAVADSERSVTQVTSNRNNNDTNGLKDNDGDNSMSNVITNDDNNSNTSNDNSNDNTDDNDNVNVNRWGPGSGWRSATGSPTRASWGASRCSCSRRSLLFLISIITTIISIT